MEQLSFDDLQLRVIAGGLPRQLPPVMQWRKLIRRVQPPSDAKCSLRCFRAVATVLADYANRNGRSCFPSVETIAADAGYSERSVQYALQALEWRGLIGRDKRGGRGRTTRYRLRVPGVDNGGDKAVDEKGAHAAKGASGDSERVQPLAPEVRPSQVRQVEPLADASVAGALWNVGAEPAEKSGLDWGVASRA